MYQQSTSLSTTESQSAQVGGLADVVTGLAKACLERGHQVEVMLPFYECLPEEEIADLQHELDFDAPKVPPMAFPRSPPSFICGLVALAVSVSDALTGAVQGCVLLSRPSEDLCQAPSMAWSAFVSLVSTEADQDCILPTSC